MKVEFVRFKATDGVELQGWLNRAKSNRAVLHIHGMSGNGYENSFLDDLRSMYRDLDISFFSIDTRGRGIISEFRQVDSTKLGGSCFEIFEESVYDIDGAVHYLKSIGINEIILQGHSLGCTKVVHYMLSSQADRVVVKLILIAPTDMVRWAELDERHEQYLSKAKKFMIDGSGEELVGSQCWMDKTPLSAQTYPTICEAGSNADIFGEREGGALINRIQHKNLIVYGSEDIGITRIDGTIESWKKRVDPLVNKNTRISTIEGAGHSFVGYEQELSKHIETFLTQPQ